MEHTCLIGSGSHESRSNIPWIVVALLIKCCVHDWQKFCHWTHGNYSQNSWNMSHVRFMAPVNNIPWNTHVDKSLWNMNPLYKTNDSYSMSSENNVLWVLWTLFRESRERIPVRHKSFIQDERLVHISGITHWMWSIKYIGHNMFTCGTWLMEQ